jgi:IS30 family transposase
MSHTHLTRVDRVSLAVLLRAEKNYEEIAVVLGFHATSIGREVTAGGGRKSYTVKAGQKQADQKRRAANQCHRKMGKDAVLTDTVKSLLELQWSPEQIVGRMGFERDLGLVPTSQMVASTTTIYAWANPCPELCILLPRKHSKYRRTRSASLREQRRKELKTKRNISTRPPEVETRERLGDWEGDTIIGAEKKERILTHVERTSGYLRASKTRDGTAEEIRRHTEKDFKDIPASKRKTCTYDNGKENEEWELTEKHLAMTIYFANPYHSWERGTSENTNGLLRRPFPKGTPFATITDKQLAAQVMLINHRPRKRLGWKTPHEVFYEAAIRTLI